MRLNGRWFPQIVDRGSGNLYPIYIKQGNSVARDLPPTGSEANTTNNFFFYTHPPPPLHGKFCFLEMLEVA